MTCNKEYPGFATDMQAQYMALIPRASVPVITENILRIAFARQRVDAHGADIRIDGARATVTGRPA